LRFFIDDLVLGELRVNISFLISADATKRSTNQHDGNA
jgi:hypothetical protein